MRTTLDIDKPILGDLRRLAKKRHRSMGKVASDLLAEAIGTYKSPTSRDTFQWHGKPMKAKVNLMDHEAVYEAMDKGREVR